MAPTVDLTDAEEAEVGKDKEEKDEEEVGDNEADEDEICSCPTLRMATEAGGVLLRARSLCIGAELLVEDFIAS